MQQCWLVNPNKRPSASNLIASISSYCEVDHTRKDSYHSESSTLVTEGLPMEDTSAQALVKSSDDEISIRLEESEGPALEGGNRDSVFAMSEPDVLYQNLSEGDVSMLSSQVRLCHIAHSVTYLLPCQCIHTQTVHKFC